MSVTPPLAVQLYSVREQAERDLPGTLRRLAACGYTAVEPYAWHGATPRDFQRLLRSNGLDVVGFHCSLENPADWPAAVDAAAEIGARLIVVPWSDPDTLHTLDDVERLAARIETARAVVATRGLALGYHNHWWEHARRIEDATLHQHLLARLHPDVFVELDVYWTAFGRRDPVAVLHELGPRVRLIHLKDGPADAEESLMTALGDGTLDLPGILAAARHVEAHVVEIDACEGDIFVALERSATRVRTWTSGASEARSET